MAWLVFLLAATGIASAQSSEASLAKQSAAAEKQFAAAAKQGSGFERKPQAFSGFTSTWYSLAQDPKLQTAWISVPDCEPLASEDLNKMIDSVATKAVDPALVTAVVNQESARRPCAVSAKGALGLMQIMPELASDEGMKDPFNPEENLRVGVRYLERLLERFKDLKLALAAYNAGPARVEAAGSIPDIEETKSYVASILRRLGRPSE